MCSNLDLAYRFLHYLVGIFDHMFDKMQHQTKLHTDAWTLREDEYCTCAVGALFIGTTMKVCSQMWHTYFF